MLQTIETGKILEIPIDISKSLTPDIYLKIFRRITANIRHKMYEKVRLLKKGFGKSLSQSEIQKITSEIKKLNFKDKVCKKYNIEKEEDENYAIILKRAYYAYLMNEKFNEQSDMDKIWNDKLIVAILKNWLIPDMDKNPEDFTDENLFVFFGIRKY